MDARWVQLADLLVNYSTKVVPGDRVLIDAIERETADLATAVYEAALVAGGIPHVQVQATDLERRLLQLGTDLQVRAASEPETLAMEWASVYIGLRGARSPHELAAVDIDRLAAHRRVRGALSALRNASTRWVLVRVPTEPLAQQAEVSLAAMEDMFFRSTLRDWDADAAAMEGLRSRLERGSEVTIRTSGTDLTFSTAGRRYVIGAGTHNVPDGEIYTAPVESSVEGHVTFNLPAVYGGRRLDEVYLRFEGGQVVEASAKTNGELLEAVLNTDAGSRCLGEFGIGTNTAIDRYSYDILYDEKIGGTVHLALGRAYEECGGVNESAIHWDLVLDLRNAGEVVVDGTPVFREGRWVDES